jgi:hypothetical protein
MSHISWVCSSQIVRKSSPLRDRVLCSVARWSSRGVSCSFFASCSTSSRKLLRRDFLQLLGIATVGLLAPITTRVDCATAATTAAESALVEIVRTYESLDELQRLVEQFRDTRLLRQSIRVIVKQSNLSQNVKIAARARLPAGPIRDGALREGLDAIEFLNQVIAYYDPVTRIPTTEMQEFARESIKAAQMHLRAYLDAFPPDEVERAQRTVFVQDVASYESM